MDYKIQKSTSRIKNLAKKFIFFPKKSQLFVDNKAKKHASAHRDNFFNKKKYFISIDVRK
jgi:uncharacterized protein YxjI